MSLRDVDVSIGIDVDHSPLAQLNRRIDEVIQSLSNISGDPLDDLMNNVQNATGDVNALNNNVNNLNSNLNNVNGNSIDNLNSSVNTAESGFGKLKGAIVAVGAAIAATIAVDKIVELGQAAVEAAAGAQALNAQFEQVFGNLQNDATATIERMGAEFNMLPSRLQGPLTSTTSMFKGLGLETEDALGKAERAISVVADAAAFYDMSFEDANSALNSFIKGNYEGGESIGLFANETQLAAFAISKGVVKAAKDWSALDEATKQATRLEYAEKMQKLAGATGQASREGEGYENMIGNLKQAWTDFLAKAGEPILEHVIDVMGWLGDALQNINPGPFVDKIASAFTAVKDIVDSAYNIIMSLVYDTGEVDDILQNLGFSEETASMIEGILMQIKGYYEDAMGTVSSFSSVVTEFVENVIVPLMPKAQEFIGTAMGFISDVVGGAINIFGSIWAIIEGLINNVIVPLFPVFQDIISTVFDVVSPILRVAGSLFGAISAVIRFLVEEIVVPLFPLIAGTISETWIVLKPILTAIADAFDVVASSIEWVIEKVGVVASKLKNLDIGGAVGKAVGWVMGDKASGFDTGLGRVPYDDMPAYLHKDEAVLQADNADVLRDAGILKGDGRNPTIDLTPQQIQVEGPRNYRTEKVSNTTTSSTSVSAPVTIIVQGSDNPQATVQSVMDVIEEFFGDLPVRMEG